MAKLKQAALNYDELPRFKNSSNSHLFPRSTERVSSKPSDTVPGKALSVRKALQRHQAGLPPIGSLTPVYLGEESYLPDIRRMDKVELAELRQINDRTIRAEMKKLQELQDAADAKKLSEAQEREIQLRVSKHLQQMRAKDPAKEDAQETK